MNGGKCNNELLSDEEVRLRDTYKKVLNAAKNEPAISRGQFFDVMYVNYNNPTLDPHRQYAYLRKDGDEVIVIVANFGAEANCQIAIPQHAFDILHLEKGTYVATEIISGKRQKKRCRPTLHSKQLSQQTAPPCGKSNLHDKMPLRRKNLP